MLKDTFSSSLVPSCTGIPSQQYAFAGSGMHQVATRQQVTFFLKSVECSFKLPHNYHWSKNLL